MACCWQSTTIHTVTYICARDFVLLKFNIIKAHANEMNTTQQTNSTAKPNTAAHSRCVCQFSCFPSLHFYIYNEKIVWKFITEYRMKETNNVNAHTKTYFFIIFSFLLALIFFFFFIRSSVRSRSLFLCLLFCNLQPIFFCARVGMCIIYLILVASHFHPLLRLLVFMFIPRAWWDLLSIEMHQKDEQSWFLLRHSFEQHNI